MSIRLSRGPKPGSGGRPRIFDDPEHAAIREERNAYNQERREKHKQLVKTCVVHQWKNVAYAKACRELSDPDWKPSLRMEVMDVDAAPTLPPAYVKIVKELYTVYKTVYGYNKISSDVGELYNLTWMELKTRAQKLKIDNYKWEYTLNELKKYYNRDLLEEEFGKRPHSLSYEDTKNLMLEAMLYLHDQKVSYPIAKEAARIYAFVYDEHKPYAIWNPEFEAALDRNDPGWQAYPRIISGKEPRFYKNETIHKWRERDLEETARHDAVKEWYEEYEKEQRKREDATVKKLEEQILQQIKAGQTDNEILDPIKQNYSKEIHVRCHNLLQEQRNRPPKTYKFKV